MTEIQLELISERHDSAGYVHTRFARPTGFDYLPGQYLVITAEGEHKARYLALASHSSEAELFLLSRHSFAGKTATTSPPQGEGFHCDFATPKPLLFITHGTGISALRPAILERRARGFTTDTLLYGVADEAHEPELDVVRNEFPLRQLRAYSRTGDHQRVQQVLPAINTSEFGAILLIGGKEMMSDVKQVLSTQGFPAERIYSNF
jgi:NAD(P)H-flavin reductase